MTETNHDDRVTEPIIEFTDLRRSFVVRQKAGRVRRTKKIVHAVDGVSVRIGAGEACGYIGANGAGKSTTIKMITGILVPTSGTVRTCGFDPVPQRRVLAREIGVVFGQRSQLWWDLPLRDSFRILAAIHRLDPEAARERTDSAGRRPRHRRISSTPPYASCRWASGCAARWPRPWCTARGCWCWTSRPSGWT